MASRLCQNQLLRNGSLFSRQLMPPTQQLISCQTPSSLMNCNYNCNYLVHGKRHMLRLRSKVLCYDNTGAKLLYVIGPCRLKPQDNVMMGRAFVGVIKKCTAGRSVQRKQIIKGLLITAKKKKRRPDGSFIQFNQNRAILLKKATKEQLTNNKLTKRWAEKTEPLGSRIKSAIPLELRQKRLKKLVLHAANVY